MAFTPYSTLNPLVNMTVMTPLAKPTWIENELDKERILSYQMYEQIYWSVPDTFKLVARSTESRPIYIPNARTIIETVNRYTAPDFGIRVEPDPLFVGGTRADPILAKEYFLSFFTRERFRSKFNGNKRYGIIRGDWLWHITANPKKEPGKQISIQPLDPASYFPIGDPNDLDKIVGCHIVDHIVEGKDTFISRLTYRKPVDETGSAIPGFITAEHSIFEFNDEWQGPEAQPIRTIQPLMTINGITNLPVYHIKHFDEPANPFGSSELRGIERVIAGVNQAVSDQELALAMEGLGFYWTDAPAPIDPATGLPGDWNIGPGRVAEIPAGRKWDRVTGVSTVEPTMRHVDYLEKSMMKASGISNAATGNVEVSVEVSGVALFLQLAPMLAKTAEDDISIIEVHGQMFHDMATEWFPVYDRVTFEGLTIVPTIGEKLPTDRKQILAELTFMIENGVAPTAFIRQEMATKLGYTFPEGIGDDVISEKASLAQAEDPYAARIAGELDTGQAPPEEV